MSRREIAIDAAFDLTIAIAFVLWDWMRGNGNPWIGATASLRSFMKFGLRFVLRFYTGYIVGFSISGVYRKLTNKEDDRGAPSIR